MADYFTKILEDDLKAVTKPQYVDQIPRAIKSTNRSVGFQITNRSQVDEARLEEITEALGEFSCL
jgi:ATP-binding cassette subfamily E protein 1